jgi:hypothetical protein
VHVSKLPHALWSINASWLPLFTSLNSPLGMMCPGQQSITCPPSRITQTVLMVSSPLACANYTRETLPCRGHNKSCRVLNLTKHVFTCIFLQLIHSLQVTGGPHTQNLAGSSVLRNIARSHKPARRDRFHIRYAVAQVNGEDVSGKGLPELKNYIPGPLNSPIHLGFTSES